MFYLVSEKNEVEAFSERRGGPPLTPTHVRSPINECLTGGGLYTFPEALRCDAGLIFCYTMTSFTAAVAPLPPYLTILYVDKALYTLGQVLRLQ